MLDPIGRGITVGLTMLVGFAVVAVEGQPCTPAWDPAVGQDGLSGPAHATAVIDDGGGKALFVGGVFETADGLPVNNIAKWNGLFWSGLTGGTNSVVYAIAGYDDGGGTDVYAGGAFDRAGGVTVSNVAVWDGSGWSPLGGATNNTVSALAVFGDGLYAGGSFTEIGGVAANRVAKWNGAFWSALGAGINYSTVEALVATETTSALSIVAPLERVHRAISSSSSIQRHRSVIVEYAIVSPWPFIQVWLCPSRRAGPRRHRHRGAVPAAPAHCAASAAMATPPPARSSNSPPRRSAGTTRTAT